MQQLLNYAPSVRIYDPGLTIPEQRMTMREAFRQHVLGGISEPRTVEAYENALDHWERRTDDPDIRDVTKETLREFRDALAASEKPRGGSYSPNTINKVMGHLAAVLNHCGPESPQNPDAIEIISRVPRLRKLKRRRPIPRAATLDEIRSMMLAAADMKWPRNPGISPVLWWRTLIVWLYNIGSRRNDFLNLRWEQINLDTAQFWSDEAKRKKQLPKPLHPYLVQRLRMMHGERELVFPKSKGTRLLYLNYYRIQERAGIMQPFTFHDLRRTACSELYKISPAAAQEMMSHGDMQTTKDFYYAPGQHLTEVSHLIPQPELSEKSDMCL